jgi:hypothetical protein
MDCAIAAYILVLAESNATTHTAADRQLYQRYLADAAALLARAVSGASVLELVPLIRDHERLLSLTWLKGPEHVAVFKAWQAVIDKAPSARAI